MRCEEVRPPQSEPLEKVQNGVTYWNRATERADCQQRKLLARVKGCGKSTPAFGNDAGGEATPGWSKAKQHRVLVRLPERDLQPARCSRVCRCGLPHREMLPRLGFKRMEYRGWLIATWQTYRARRGGPSCCGDGRAGQHCGLADVVAAQWRCFGCLWVRSSPPAYLAQMLAR